MKAYAARGVIIATVLLSVASAPAPAYETTSKNVPYLPVPSGAAVILNTGSTNTRGYRIVVDERAHAAYIVAGNAAASASLESSLGSQLFADLKAAMPLSTLPHLACMKSMSFGTSLFVWWQHERSPDLTCAGDERGRHLAADAAAIAGALPISPARTPVMRPLMPGEHHVAPPSPSASAMSRPTGAPSP